jgi:hypothetical protein
LRRRLILTLMLFTSSARIATGQDHQHGGQPPEQLGQVVFPTSCSPAAHRNFLRGLALLHSFWYEESEKTFRAAALKDPTCAIAWWGVAMSLYHPLWEPPPGPIELKHGSEAIANARTAGAKTQRERDYIAALAEFFSNYQQRDHRTRAVAWSKAMEGLHHQYPDDSEATLFYALSLKATQLPNDKTLANDRKAAALLEPLFQQQPGHPGVAHYLIHSYDTAAMAQYGVAAARRYAQIAPSAPHALHMPSHIFTRLGLWDDSISSNLASSQVARQYAEHQHLAAVWDQELHALDYLIYAYLQTGQNAKARAISDRAVALKNTQTTDIGYFALAAMPARFTIERRDWKQAAGLDPNLSATPVPQAITWWARGVGAARTGNTEKARTALARLESLRDLLQQQKSGDYWAGQVDIQRLEVAAWLAHAQGDDARALESLRSAADAEDATDKSNLTPGAITPAREMLADLQSELKLSKDALQNYEAVLRAAPRRFNALYGAAHAAELAGDREKARSLYIQFADLSRNADADRSEVEKAKVFLAAK